MSLNQREESRLSMTPAEYLENNHVLLYLDDALQLLLKRLHTNPKDNAVEFMSTYFQGGKFYRALHSACLFSFV